MKTCCSQMVLVARDLDYVILRLFDRRTLDIEITPDEIPNIGITCVYFTVINLSQNLFKVFDRTIFQLA